MAANKKKSLGVDARVLFRENIRGIGRYLRNIILRAPDDFTVTLYGYRELEHFFDLNIPQNVKIITYSMRGDRLQAWEQVGLSRQIKKNRHDLFFSPANTLPLFCPVPCVATVHDARPWQETVFWKQDFFRWIFTNWILPKALRKAKSIITISGYSQKELIELFPFIAPKTKVVYHGIENIFFNAPCWSETNLPLLVKHQSPPKYILYIGGDSYKKQAEFALKIFAIAHSDDIMVKLIMVGLSSKGRVTIHKMSRNLGIDDSIVTLPVISDNDLATLYKDAISVIYPTLHEGFGFPLIEALATGQHIIASDVASIPEVAGGFATLLPPANKKKWVSELRLIFRGESQFNEQAIQDRKKYARRFSWEQCAQKTYQIFRMALE